MWTDELNATLRKVISRIGLYGLLGICILLFLFYKLFFQTPRDFKPDSTIRIENGESLRAISNSLEENGIVSSSFWLANLVILMGGEHRVVAGYYLFQNPNDLFRVARRITTGNFGIVPVKITIPEGLNTSEITDLYKSKFNLFDSNAFLALAKPNEGYLFPETYFFVPTVVPADVIYAMKTTFDEKTVPLQGAIATSTHSLKDIITMASILEGEAKLTADRKIIAGILWSRIADGTRLQVDATFKYINGKTSSELSAADLKIDSPYNTYKYSGLPPTPISNPGLDSIMAALYPTKTDYYYFVSDKNGNIHYAKTFKEQLANEKKYL